MSVDDALFIKAIIPGKRPSYLPTICSLVWVNGRPVGPKSLRFAETRKIKMHERETLGVETVIFGESEAPAELMVTRSSAGASPPEPFETTVFFV